MDECSAHMIPGCMVCEGLSTKETPKMNPELSKLITSLGFTNTSYSNDERDSVGCTFGNTWVQVYYGPSSNEHVGIFIAPKDDPTDLVGVYDDSPKFAVSFLRSLVASLTNGKAFSAKCKTFGCCGGTLQEGHATR